MAKPRDRLNFPECPDCPYVEHGTWSICSDCASEQHPAIVNPCPLCSQEESADFCANYLCQNDEQRHFENIYAVTMHKGKLQEKLKLFKEHGKTGWGIIFARMLIGYLETHQIPSAVDIIIANPSNPGREHIDLVFRRAAEFYSGNRWKFDSTEDPAITKRQATTRSRIIQSQDNRWEKKKQAAIEHAEALVLKHPERIAGKSVVVYDDICTTCNQLNKVACRLKKWGALKVYGIVLARHPWKNKQSLK